MKNEKMFINLKNSDLDVYNPYLELSSVQRKTKKCYRIVFLGTDSVIINSKIIKIIKRKMIKIISFTINIFLWDLETKFIDLVVLSMMKKDVGILVKKVLIFELNVIFIYILNVLKNKIK